MIFPRNDTYALPSSNFFPVVLAIQNAKVAWDFGFNLQWSILAGEEPEGGIGFLAVEGSGTNPNKPVPPSDPYFFINSTLLSFPVYNPNITHWTLQWKFSFGVTCSSIEDKIGFVDAEGTLNFTTISGENASTFDLLPAGSCPSLGSLVGIQANLTGCPETGEPVQSADPCAVTVDQALSSSVSSNLASYSELIESGIFSTILPTKTNSVSGATTTPSGGMGTAVAPMAPTTTGASSPATVTESRVGNAAERTRLAEGLRVVAGVVAVGTLLLL